MLSADLPAGEWRLIADGIVIETVDVRFEILHRRRDVDQLIVSWQQHFEPSPNVSQAQVLELTATGAGIQVDDGGADALVFRYTGQSASVPMAYIPNGEGARTGGRVPSIILPE